MRVQREGLTGLRPEGCGRPWTHLRCEGSEGSKGSQGSEGKVDGPPGRRLWPPVGGGLCSLRSGGDSACGAEGCGLPLCGNAYKVSVTGLAFYVIWHDTHAGDWLAALATPPIRQCYLVKEQAEEDQQN